MRRWLLLFVVCLFATPVLTGRAQTNFVISDYQTFGQALASSTNLTNFQANAQIVLPAGLTFEPPTNVVIDGGANNVTFSGSNVTRILHVRPRTTNTLRNVTFRTGSATQGGAIYNEGTLVVSNCAFGGNIATNISGANGATGGHNGNGTDGISGLGGAGGAIFSKGPLTVLFCTFTNNSAKGGNGGHGGDGIAQFIFGGSGGNGGNGGGASGGAIYSASGSNYIFATLFEGNSCVCGSGGAGGAAAGAQFAAEGGKGGIGGSGNGGAIFCNGPLRIEASFFQANSVAGGVTAAAQGAGDNNPLNASAGGSAGGGAIFLGGGASGSFVTNCTILVNACVGGTGGSITSGSSGNAGPGGQAFGAGIASAAGAAQVQYCTIATNQTEGGASGASGGAAGPIAGSQIYASPGVVRLTGSIISGAAHGLMLNATGVADGGFNISSDVSGISQATSLANRNPLLSVEVGAVVTNMTVSSNGTVVTTNIYPTTNFISPVITNFLAITNTAYPSNLLFFDLTTNFLPLGVVEYAYDLIINYTYTNVGTGLETNETFTTNFVAGSNGGPTPTLSLSNGSPALNFVTGIPGISFPLLDQRLYYRVSPTALGAFDPNGVPGLIVTNGGTTNNFTIIVTFPTNVPPTFAEYYDVPSFVLTNGGSNILFLTEYGTNAVAIAANTTIQTNSVFKPGTNIVEIATNIPIPVISGPPALGLGQGAMLTATVATNTPGLGFQWQLNGSNLTDNANFAGTTTSNLTLRNITARMQSNYTVIAGTTLNYVQTSLPFTVYVTELPRLTFTAPAAGARTAADSVMVRGTVTLASTVTNIQLWLTNLNDGSALDFSVPFASSKSTAAWSAVVQPHPGTNVLAAWTIDTSGFPSPTETRKFFSVGAGQITILTEGSGTVSGATDKSKLNVGQSYTLVANPGPRYLFANWTVLTNNVAEILQDGSPTLHFLMEENTVVTATFITNMFLPAPQVYNGLFYPEGTNHGTPGIITGLTVGATGAYSAKVFAWGFQTNESIKGIFNPTNGFSSNSVPGLTNDIVLSLTNTGEEIIGTAVNPSGTATVTLERVVKTNVTAAYTLLFVPLPTDAVSGYGYALLTNRNGTTVISGSLGDGTAFSEAVGVSSDGLVPFFAPLYTNTGVIFGWVPPEGEATSNLVWLKPVGSGGLFPAGFSNSLGTVSALWKTTPAISLADGGEMTFTNGGLTAPLTLDFTFGKGNRLSNTNNGNFAVINPNNGLFTVTITNGNADGITTAKGVVMKNLTNGSVSGGGYFLTATNSGAMILTPNP